MTAKNVLLSIDQGTTATKALLLDQRLQVLGEESVEFPQHFPQPGWVEHDPAEIWQSVEKSVKRVLERSGIDASAIAAIGITNQRETTLLWDGETGQPVHRALVWQDRRTADQCARMQGEGLEARFRQRTGLLVDPYFSGTKIRWILDN
ncbi:MAG TPA: FGGY family carbohydrate kinase, partial [Planctomycetota bacterium]|nr:FGGY family carbohydrate kinase [Planctomycetota bacterium]